MLNVNPVTIRRWFKRGLDWCKVGGQVRTSLEALNRFKQDGYSQPVMQVVGVDRETVAALRSLKSRGIVFGLEAKNVGNQKATVG